MEKEWLQLYRLGSHRFFLVFRLIKGGSELIATAFFNIYIMKKTILLLGFLLFGTVFAQTTIEDITLATDYDVSGGDKTWSWYIGEGVITWSVFGSASALTGTLDGTITIQEAFLDAAPDSVYVDYNAMPEWTLNEESEQFAFEDDRFSGKWIRVTLTVENITSGVINTVILRLVK